MDATAAITILRRLLDFLELPYGDIHASSEEDFVRFDIASPQASRIIGWHGETLNSLQHLVKCIVRAEQKLEANPFLVLDVDGYRRMQEDKVRSATEQKADFVRRTGNRVTLAPMSPYFRRIVHLHVANTPTLRDLTTESTGEGDYRQVVLKLKEEKKRDAKVGEELSPVIATSSDEGLENLDV